MKKQVIGILLFAAVGLAGCPSANIYGTARTTPVGRVMHTAAIEGIGATSRGVGIFAPNFPTYQARIGVHDRIDIGVRLSNLSMLGVDAKFNIVRTSVFDFALMPGIQGTYVAINLNSTGSGASGFGIAYGHLPLIASFNANEYFSLVLTGGVGFAVGGGSVSSSGGFLGSGVNVRGGIGFNIRPTRFIAIHPELSVLYFPESQGAIFLPGIGLNFGRNPDYGPEPQAQP